MICLGLLVFAIVGTLAGKGLAAVHRNNETYEQHFHQRMYEADWDGK